MLRPMTFFAAALLATGALSFSQADAAVDPANAPTACRAAGFSPGEAPFADCVAALRSQAAPHAAIDDNTARALQTCTLLGYDANSEPFATCAANMTQTLFDRSGPQS